MAACSATLLLTLCASSGQGAPLQGEAIVVTDEASGCMTSEGARKWKPPPPQRWEAVPGGYRCADRFVTDETIAALRALLAERRGTPPDLLERIGVDAGALHRHRHEILRAAFGFDAAPPEAPPELEAEIARHLEFELLAPHILDEVLGRNWFSTSKRHFEVRLPGSPALTVSSHGLVPWMLPWEVTLGEERWTVADPALSLALLPLADPDGPCARSIDGRSYWSGEFWSDEGFWDPFLGSRVVQAQALGDAAWWPGYMSLVSSYEVRELAWARVDGARGSRFFEITWEGAGPIRWAHWTAPLDEDGRPRCDWNAFVALFDSAQHAAGRHPWLRDFSRAAPQRSVGLRADGTSGIAERELDERVGRAWAEAGFHGRPGYELVLQREGSVCGRVYVSEAESGALIESASPSTSGEHHWFDRMSFSLHPKGDEPLTYGRMGADGKLERRTLSLR